MQKTEKFFIFTWKELTVIGLLFLISIGFFFTLGLHYGKKLHPSQAATETTAPNLEESPENVPPKDALDEASQHTAGATQDAIKGATQEQLDASGMKVDEPKPVDLPSEKTVGKTAHPAKAEHGAKSDHAPKSEHAEKATEHSKPEAKEAARDEEKPAAQGDAKFAVQLGSYPAKKEAQMKISALKKRNIHGEVRIAVVEGQTRFRVVIPGFKTRALAEQKGKALKAEHKIDSFVVIKSE